MLLLQDFAPHPHVLRAENLVPRRSWWKRSGVTSNVDPPVLAPRQGRHGNSPALQCRGQGVYSQSSPGGTAEITIHFSRPPGLWEFFFRIPSTEVLGYSHGIPPGCLSPTTNRWAKTPTKNDEEPIFLRVKRRFRRVVLQRPQRPQRPPSTQRNSSAFLCVLGGLCGEGLFASLLNLRRTVVFLRKVAPFCIWLVPAALRTV